MKTDISTSLGVTHAGAGPLLSPPPREISLSSSNVSNDGSSYESPSSFAASGTVPTESGSDSNSEHRNTLKTTSSINEILGPILKTIFAVADGALKKCQILMNDLRHLMRFNPQQICSIKLVLLWSAKENINWVTHKSRWIVNYDWRVVLTLFPTYTPTSES